MSKEIENINLSYQADTTVDDVKQNKDIYSEKVLQSRIDSATPIVKRYISSSETNKEAVKNDIEDLSFLEKASKNIYNSWAYSDDEAKLNKNYYHLGVTNALGLKKDVVIGGYNYGSGLGYIGEDNRSPKDIYKEIQNMEGVLKEKIDYTGDSVTQKVLSGLTSVAAGMYDTIVEHPALIGGAATTGAGAGFLAGGGAFSLQGALIGGSAAGFAAFRTAAAIDQFQISGGMVVREALNSEYKNKLTKEEVATAALLTGAASAALEFAFVGSVGKAADVKSINKFTKFFSPKEMLKKIAEKSPDVMTYAAIVKEGLKSGGENALQDLAQKLGNEWVKQGGGLEAQNILNAQTLEDTGVSFLTGSIFTTGIGTIRQVTKIKNTGAANSVIADTTQAATENVPNVEVKPEPQKKLTQIQLSEKSVKTLKNVAQLKERVAEYQERLDKISIKDTIAMDELQKEYHGDNVAYIHPEEVADLDPKFVEAYKNQTGKDLSTNETNVIPLNVLMKVAKEQNNIFDHIVMSPDETPKSKIDKFIDESKKNSEALVKLQARLDIETDPEVVKKLKEEITQVESNLNEDVYDVNSAAEKTLIPEKIKEIVDPEVYKDLVEVQTKLAEEKIGKLEYENHKAIDLETEQRLIEEMDVILSDIDNDPRIELTKKFEQDYQLTPDVGSRIASAYPDLDLNEYLLKKDRKGSLIAINPDTLPDSLRHLAKDPELKKHGLFSKDGLDYNGYDAIAVSLGYKDTESLIDNGIRKSLTRAELEQLKLDKDYGMIRKQVEAKLKLTKEDYLKAFENKAKIDVANINAVLKEKTGTAKKLIKGLTTKLKTTDELKAQVKVTADNLTYKEADAKRFRRNSNKFLRDAGKYLTSGNLLGYFSALEKRALNTLLEGEVQYRTDKIKMNLKKTMSILNRKENIDTLVRAGDQYVDTVIAIKNIIEFNPRKNFKEADRLKSLVQTLREQGAVIREFDADFLNDTKVSINDMNLKTIETLNSLVSDIFEQAKRKDLLITAKIEGERSATVAKATKDIRFEAGQKKYFQKDLETENEKLLIDVKDKNALSWWDRYKGFTGLHGVYADYIGPSYKKYIYNPLVSAQIEYSKNNRVIQQKLSEATLGVKDFNKMIREEVIVPELSKNFKEGKVTKATIFQMLLNLGNDGNRKALEKSYGLTADQFKKIVETHLDESHLKAAKEISKVYSNVLNPLRKELHKRNNTTPANDIELGKTTLFGKEVNEWYYPIKTQKKLDAFLNSRNLQLDVDEILNGRFDFGDNPLDSHVNYFSDIEREGASSNFIVSLDPAVTQATIEQSLRGALFTDPVNNVLKTLSQKDTQDAIKGTVGNTVFENVILRGIVDEIRGGGQAQANSTFVRWTNNIMNNYALSKLAFKLTSVAKQAASVPLMIVKLNENAVGASGTKYLFDAATSLTDIHVLKDTITSLSKISPDFADKLDLTISSSFNSLQDGLSDFYQHHGGKFDQLDKSKLKELHRVFTTSGVSFLTSAATLLNASQYVAAFNMAKDGKIKGIDPNDISKVRLHAETMVRTSLEANTNLDKPNFAKDPMMKALSGMFVSQANILLQNTIIGAKEVRDGEFVKGTSKIFTSSVLNTVVAGYLGALVTDAISSLTGDDKEGKYPHEDLGELAMDSIFGNAPLFRDLVQFYKLRNYERMAKSYPTPLSQLGNAITESASGVMKLLETGEALNKKQVKALGEVMTAPLGIPSFLATDIGEATAEVLDQVRNLSFLSQGGKLVDPNSPEGVALKIALDESKEVVKNDSQKSALVSSIGRKILYNTIRDNPSQNVLGEHLLTDKEYNRLKYGTEAIGLQLKSDFGADTSYLTQKQWDKIRQENPSLKLVQNIKDASDREIFNATWKYNEKVVNVLKANNEPITLENIYAGYLLDEEFEKFLKAPYAEKLEGYTILSMAEGMNKSDLLNRLKDDLADNIEQAVKNVDSK